MPEYVIAYTGLRGGPRRFKAVEAEDPEDAKRAFESTGKSFVKNVYTPVPRDRFGGMEDPAKVSDRQMRQWDKSTRAQRDEYTEKIRTAEADDLMLSHYRSQVSYYRLTLSELHIWTDGAYGQSLDDQRAEAGEES